MPPRLAGLARQPAGVRAATTRRRANFASEQVLPDTLRDFRAALEGICQTLNARTSEAPDTPMTVGRLPW